MTIDEKKELILKLLKEHHIIDTDPNITMDDVDSFIHHYPFVMEEDDVEKCFYEITGMPPLKQKEKVESKPDFELNDENTTKVFDLVIGILSDHQCNIVDIAYHMLHDVYRDRVDVPGSYWEPKHEELNPLVDEAQQLVEEFHEKLTAVEEKMNTVYRKYDES